MLDKNKNLQIVASQHKSPNVSHVLSASVLHLVAERHHSHIQTPEVTRDHRQICVMVHLLCCWQIWNLAKRNLQDNSRDGNGGFSCFSLAVSHQSCHSAWPDGAQFGFYSAGSRCPFIWVLYLWHISSHDMLVTVDSRPAFHLFHTSQFSHDNYIIFLCTNELICLLLAILSSLTWIFNNQL